MASDIIPAMRTALRQYLERHPFGNPDRLHPDHRPQLVQPRVTESLSKGAEVLYPEDLSR